MQKKGFPFTPSAVAFVIALLALVTAAPVQAAEPLKVFILSGQSNMQGHAKITTFEHIGMDPKTAPLLKEMQSAGGKPTVCKDVYISYLSGSKGGPTEKNGALTAGFGGGDDKIGPEFTFGLYMHKHLNEPILLIKTAWGGKSLHTDFLSPSGRELRNGQETGPYYKLMMEHVKKVLADPGKYHPAYNKEAGYEIAGFVWFQGWNDMVNGGVYPQRGSKGGYDLYSKLFAHFIRDIRKELDAPKLPFVIGVMGVGGPTKNYKSKRYVGIHQNFRDAMAAPAAMPEFKDTVAAVLTENYWDAQLAELDARKGQIGAKIKAEEKKRKLSRDERTAFQEKLTNELFKPEELKILQAGKSNAGFHYMGSGKVLAQIGKGFAEAMAELMKKN